MRLDEIPIKSLPHTSGRTLKQLENLSIHTYQDLLNHFPFRYEDYSTHVEIGDVLSGKVAPYQSPADDGALHLVSVGKVSVVGTVASFASLATRRGITVQKIKVQDETGHLELTLFNQPYLRSIMRIGTPITLSGHVKNIEDRLQFQTEEFEVGEAAEKGLHTRRLVPVYPQTKGLSSKTLREKIHAVLEMYADALPHTLPEEIRNTYKLQDDSYTYNNIHFPENMDALNKARYRKAFDELFVIQLSSQLIKMEWQKEVVQNALDVEKYTPLLQKMKKSLPFTLTEAQEKALTEILSDLPLSKPMNRLLQGDVGSGKTVIAVLAAYVAYLNGLQTLIMVPTEILAQQHFSSISKLFSFLKGAEVPKIGLMTRTNPLKESERATHDIIIGTQSLIGEAKNFDKVGLVIVDEQHKFGVAQRAQLKSKGFHPHMLSMTATPIPRTVMLTLHGELDITVLDQQPAGRLPVKTYITPQPKRKDAYEWIRTMIHSDKTQAFIVCPLIETSESESLVSVKAAKAEFETLQKDIYPDLKLGLLHGKMKKDEKEDIMAQFLSNDLNVLVTTPVIEVGIDIPNATVIVIEAAERFGLAQLHQLRGRVGRSDKQSHCVVFTESKDPHAQKRLQYFSQTPDGFKLAEYDLKHRGGGTLFGTQQHGVDSLKVADLMDIPLVQATHEAAKKYVESGTELEKFPDLQKVIEKYRIHYIAAN
ncbi:ATP-dependent DNA helicase RecG [Candidatus Woesebacteria bacterium]|nr:ATP-dependent DNA helicase RecG [Candidatus Woesebacteria bacterium]